MFVLGHDAHNGQVVDESDGGDQEEDSCRYIKSLHGETRGWRGGGKGGIGGKVSLHVRHASKCTYVGGKVEKNASKTDLLNSGEK